MPIIYENGAYYRVSEAYSSRGASDPYGQIRAYPVELTDVMVNPLLAFDVLHYTPINTLIGLNNALRRLVGNCNSNRDTELECVENTKNVELTIARDRSNEFGSISGDLCFEESLSVMLFKRAYYVFTYDARISIIKLLDKFSCKKEVTELEGATIITYTFKKVDIQWNQWNQNVQNVF